MNGISVQIGTGILNVPWSADFDLQLANPNILHPAHLPELLKRAMSGKYSSVMRDTAVYSSTALKVAIAALILLA